MEVVLYNSNVCRLCGEENDNGTLLYTNEENNQSLCDIINGYLPIRVSDDGELPRTICPGCTIQLEATVEFLNLIINGQKVIRELHEREKEYRKSILKNSKDEPDVITEKIVYEINTSDGVYQVEHPISLQVSGLEKPKRKRGRPPKKPKTPEELAAEAAAKERQTKPQSVLPKEETSSGKRRRKTPTRFKEVVQGAELERILKEEGVTDGEEEADAEGGGRAEERRTSPSKPEVIGHLESAGELVLVVHSKGRGRPKGRVSQKHEQCVICGMEFTCLGRYMSHVAQHGPVRYRCHCGDEFRKRLHFNDHQRDTGHTGLTVVNCDQSEDSNTKEDATEAPVPVEKETDTAPDLLSVEAIVSNVQAAELPALPDLNPVPLNPAPALKQQAVADEAPTTESPADLAPSLVVEGPVVDSSSMETYFISPIGTEDETTAPAGKQKLPCNQCDKVFSSKQSKSLHIKAVHQGERPYVCKECGASFAYPRSLALHAVAHRRRGIASSRGFACDLCGKVLNHPSSVVYHKQSVHAAQRYVCGACGKRFHHKQLLQRHQLVHSQLRPFSCKVCTATFKTKANLLNHQLLHTGVKKFTCEICKHKFSHKTSLTLHMRWHAGVKPYQCGVCQKSFSQKGNLSEHERIHTGEKPYACALCPRRFTTSSQHRLHTRRHARARSNQARREAGASEAGAGEAGAGTHRCGACGGTFASRWALAQHARSTHHNAAARRRAAQKQMSLLVSEKIQQGQQVEAPPVVPAGGAEPDAEESVIYVTYNVDDADSPSFHILDPEQAVSLDDSKVLTTCELYSGSSLLVSQQAPPLALQRGPAEMDDEHIDLDADFHHGHHLPVTDEQGNPLHFTMQDGTRLAITSSDGKSLQVITQDGQTIPVEINGFTEEDALNTDTVVHQLNIQKSVDSDSAVTHYYTLV